MDKFFLWWGLFLILMPLGSYAQQQRLIGAWTQSATGDIDLVNDRLEIRSLGPVSTREENLNAADFQLFADAGAITMEDGELILRYRLPSSSGFSLPVWYRADLKVYLNGALLEPAPATEYLIGAGRVAPTEATSRIMVSHLLQQYVQLQGELRVELTVEALLDCSSSLADLPPVKFSKTPYLIAGGVGAGMLVAGGILWADAQNRYDDYLDASDADSAEPFYEKANSRRHTSLVLMFGGAAVLAGDVIAYFVRKGKLSRRQREGFQQLCLSQSVVVAPQVELPSQASPNGNLGVKFTFALGNPKTAGRR